MVLWYVQYKTQDPETKKTTNYFPLIRIYVRWEGVDMIQEG